MKILNITNEDNVQPHWSYTMTKHQNKIDKKASKKLSESFNVRNITKPY